MTEPITPLELAVELADEFDVDRDSARTAVETYLDQLSELEGIGIDHDNIGTEYADHVRNAFAAAEESTYVSTLDDLAEVRDKLDTLAELQDERAHLVRKSLADGARVTDITAASGLSRARIYQIKDGR